MAKPLSQKSKLIREAIKAHPDTSNRDLAKLLNDSSERIYDKIKVTGNDISQQKVALKNLGDEPAAEVAQPVTPEENGQEAEPPAPAHQQAAPVTPQPAAEPTVTSKAEAVRIALAQGAVMPEDGVAFIKRRFDLDITPGMFSSYKSQMKGKEGAKPKGRPGRKPGQKTMPVLQAAAQIVPAAPAGDLIDDMAVVKALVAKLGAGQVKRVVDLFG